MLQTGESENEILLGNKQLLAIFFVVVLLLGIAFAGGYKLGQGAKKGATATSTEVAASTPATETPGQTHEVPAGGTPDSSTAAGDTATTPAETAIPPQVQSRDTEAAGPSSGEPLGTKKRTKSTKSDERATPAQSAPAETRGEFTPEPGQSFLQVAAVGRDEAEAVADVLHKKGFRAHAVPKPGNPKIYRVLIGPLDGTADLSTTRDSLRRTGFREVITQRY